MVASTVTVQLPIDGIVLSNTYVRPSIQVAWTGGVGPFDVEYTWDDDPTFANGNGNRQQVTNTSVTSIDSAAPTADLADLTVTWYVRANVIDQGDSGNALADSSHSFSFFDPIDKNRFLYLLANVGVGYGTQDTPPELQLVTNNATSGTFTLSFSGQGPTSGIAYNASKAAMETAIEALSNVTDVEVWKLSPQAWLVRFNTVSPSPIPAMTANSGGLTGGTASVSVITDDNSTPWGTGGTVGPDGDTISFNRFLHLLANVGVGFTYDTPRETQIVSNNATAGTFTLSFDGQGPTVSIAYNGDATAMETALEGLSNVTDVEVIKITPQAWLVTFVSTTADPIPLLTATDSLTGGSTTIDAIVDDATPWGTGGTVDPDGANIGFNRFLYQLANVGVGYSFDEPVGGWGTGGIVAPDGDNRDDFARFLYQLANVEDTQPPPFIFRIEPEVAKIGDSISIYGQGLVADPTYESAEPFSLTGLGQVYTGQTCDVTPDFTVDLQSFRFYGNIGGTHEYELFIGGVSQGKRTATTAAEELEWFFPVPITLTAAIPVEFSVVIDSADRMYYNTTSGPRDLGTVTITTWEERTNGTPAFNFGLILKDYGEEVRLYAAPGTAGSYVVMPITGSLPGDTEDRLDVTVPIGAEIDTFDYVTVAHTTPSLVLSNQAPLRILEIPAIDSGWWIEVWEPDGSARRLSPIPVHAFSFEHILNEVGFGEITLHHAGERLADGTLHPAGFTGRQLLDQINNPDTSPPVTSLVKVYLDGRPAYSFYPQRDLLSWDENGRPTIAGPGREKYLEWALAYPADTPANPIQAGSTIYGSVENVLENGGGEDGDGAIANSTFETGDAEGWNPYIGSDPLTVRAVSSTVSRSGGASLQVIPSNGSGIGAGVVVDLSGPVGSPVQDRVIIEAWIRDVVGSGDSVVVKAIYDDGGEQILDTATVVLSTSWQLATLAFFVPTANPLVQLAIINSDGTTAFHVDDVRADYSTAPFQPYGAGDTFHIDQANVSAGRYSIKVIPDVQYGGVAQIVDTVPGRLYRSTVALVGTAGDVIELSAQTAAGFPNATVTLTGDPTVDALTVQWTAGPDQESVRNLLRNISASPSPFWFDEWTVSPGEAATSPGGVVSPLFTAAQARGALLHYSHNASAAVDSFGAVWAELALEFAYDHGDTIRQVSDRLVGLGALEWIVSDSLEWITANKIGSDLTTLPENVPTIRATPAVRNDTELTRKQSEATFVFFEGANGRWTTAADATLQTGLLRRELYVRNSEVTAGATLGKYALATLDDQRQRTFALSVVLNRDSDIRPYRDFGIGDTILIDLFNPLGADNNPRPFRIRGFRVSARGDALTYEVLVNTVAYRDPQSRQSILLERLVRQGTIRSLSAGRGTVGDV